MYLYVKAVLRARGLNKTWQQTDISLMLLSTIFNTFHDGHIELTNSTLGPGSYYIDLNALRHSTVAYYNLAFETWLSAIGATVLPALSAEPIYTTTTALYSDAWQSNFHIQRVYPGDPEGDGHPLTQCTDLYITKDFILPPELQHQALVSVNGLLHQFDTFEDGIVVRDGGRSADLTRSNHVGVMSLVPLGLSTRLSVTDDMITTASIYISARQTFYINTGLDLTDRSVMISLGGYLHVADGVCEIINANPGIVRVTMSRIDWTRRLFEMRRVINIDHLELSRPYSNPDAILVAETQSDAFARRLLTMSQSFLIFVDTPILHRDTIVTHKPTLPGQYETAAEPLYPLISNTGRFMEYWTQAEYGCWVMRVDPNMAREYLYETTAYQDVHVVTEVVIKENQRFVNAHLLAVSTTRIS